MEKYGPLDGKLYSKVNKDSQMGQVTPKKISSNVLVELKFKRSVPHLSNCKDEIWNLLAPKKADTKTFGAGQRGIIRLIYFFRARLNFDWRQRDITLIQEKPNVKRWAFKTSFFERTVNPQSTTMCVQCRKQFHYPYKQSHIFRISNFWVYNVESLEKEMKHVVKW